MFNQEFIKIFIENNQYSSSNHQRAVVRITNYKSVPVFGALLTLPHISGISGISGKRKLAFAWGYETR